MNGKKEISMAGFVPMKTESIHTRLETVLERTFEISNKEVHIHGTASSLSLGFFLSQTYSKVINSDSILLLVLFKK